MEANHDLSGVPLQWIVVLVSPEDLVEVRVSWPGNYGVPDISLKKKYGKTKNNEILNHQKNLQQNKKSNMHCLSVNSVAVDVFISP